MKMVACAVRDAAVMAFTPPFFVRTKGEAIRSFVQACADDKLPFKANPKDYSVWLLFEWDDSNGAVIPVEQVVLMTAMDAVDGLREAGA